MLNLIVCLFACMFENQGSAEELSMFTGEEEIFAFQRTVSRLTEMQTEQYWNNGDRSKKEPPSGPV